MGEKISCILTNDCYKKVLKHKTEMQKGNFEENISLTDAIEDLLWKGLSK